MKQHDFLRAALVAAALCAAVGAKADTNEEGWTGQVGAVLGRKSLNSDDWPQLDKHGSVGMLLDFRRQHWPVSIAVDLFGTGDGSSRVDGKRDSYTAEAHLGLRKVFTFSDPSCHLRPYVGGGLSLAFAELKDGSGEATKTEEDTGTGYWLGAGGYYDVNPSLSLVADVRYSEADLELFDASLDSGGVNLSLGAVYRW